MKNKLILYTFFIVVTLFLLALLFYSGEASNSKVLIRHSLDGEKWEELSISCEGWLNGHYRQHPLDVLLEGSCPEPTDDDDDDPPDPVITEVAVPTATSTPTLPLPESTLTPLPTLDLTAVPTGPTPAPTWDFTQTPMPTLDLTAVPTKQPSWDYCFQEYYHNRCGFLPIVIMDWRLQPDPVTGSK